jgi:hypothetical protein
MDLNAESVPTIWMASISIHLMPGEITSTRAKSHLVANATASGPSMAQRVCKVKSR